MTVLPTEEPETIPQSAEEMTATLAGPPLDQPATRLVNEMKKLAISVRSRKAPKIIKSAMKRKESRGLHFNIDYPKLLDEAKDTVLIPSEIF